jgi:hypothetical protein
MQQASLEPNQLLILIDELSVGKKWACYNAFSRARMTCAGLGMALLAVANSGKIKLAPLTAAAGGTSLISRFSMLNYNPIMTKAMFRALELGPNVWVPTSMPRPKGTVEFFRGFGNFGRDRGRPTSTSEQFGQWMSGKSSGNEVRFVGVVKPGEKIDLKVLSAYADPVAVRGVAPKNLIKDPKEFNLFGSEPGEMVLPPNTVLTDYTTDVGFFLKPNPSFHDGTSYLRIYEHFESQGYRAPPQSRGYTFVEKLRRIYAKSKLGPQGEVLNVESLTNEIRKLFEEYSVKP